HVPRLQCVHLSVEVPATTVVVALSLHDALPISWYQRSRPLCHSCLRPVWRTTMLVWTFGQWARALSALAFSGITLPPRRPPSAVDRKSTRLNSSHVKISYAVFCLKKKNNAVSPP